jgi:hypothetical protein
MIWQFGERGYDISINDFGGRLSEKPPYWNYLNNPDRTDLFQVMAKLNELKQTYPEFSPESFTTDLTAALKWYRLTNGSNHVLAVGNFDVLQKTATVTFPKTGKWYEFFTRDSILINTASQSILMAPGEYRLYSTRKFDDPHVVTENTEMSLLTENVILYPNPSRTEINISSSESFTEIEVYSVTGKSVFQKTVSGNHLKLNVERFSPGIYLLKVVQNNGVSTIKFIKD